MMKQICKGTESISDRLIQLRKNHLVQLHVWEIAILCTSVLKIQQTTNADFYSSIKITVGISLNEQSTKAGFIIAKLLVAREEDLNTN